MAWLWSILHDSVLFCVEVICEWSQPLRGKVSLFEISPDAFIFFPDYVLLFMLSQMTPWESLATGSFLHKILQVWTHSSGLVTLPVFMPGCWRPWGKNLHCLSPKQQQVIAPTVFPINEQGASPGQLPVQESSMGQVHLDECSGGHGPFVSTQPGQPRHCSWMHLSGKLLPPALYSLFLFPPPPGRCHAYAIKGAIQTWS